MLTTALRSWYPNRTWPNSPIAGIEYYEEPGNERAPFYDLEPTTRALGWRPTIDLNANAPPLKRRPVVLVPRFSVAEGCVEIKFRAPHAIDARLLP